MPELQVPMPKLSMTMQEGELLAWVKQEGDQVQAGEVPCEAGQHRAGGREGGRRAGANRPTGDGNQ